MNPRPPNAEELGGGHPRCLDTQYMLRNFLGKNREQAMTLLEHDWVTEDFAYMTPAGLRYYLPAVLDYLRSPGPNGRWFAQGLLCSLHCQVIIPPGMPGDVLALIREVAALCQEHRCRLFENPDGDPLLASYFAAIADGRVQSGLDDSSG